MDLQKPNENETSNPYSGYEQVSGYSLPPRREKKTGLAVASLILGIISLFGFCCCFVNILTAPIAIILGIVSIAKKRDGTGLSVVGIVFSVLSLLLVFAGFWSVRDLLPHSEEIMTDYMQLINDQDVVFPAYKEDKTLPEYMEKYKESPYTEFFAKYDMDIYDVMDVMLDQYENGQLKTYEFSVPASSSSSSAETLPADAPVL